MLINLLLWACVIGALIALAVTYGWGVIIYIGAFLVLGGIVYAVDKVKP